MSTQNINLSVPTDIIYEMKTLPDIEDSINSKLMLSLAIGMFVSREISLAKAAQLAGINLMDFMGILKKHGIPAVVYTEGMFEDDLKAVNVDLPAPQIKQRVKRTW